jgi:hypothetical protein
MGDGMTDVWTSQELDRLGTADEIQISPRHLDGSDDPFTTIWVVRVDDGLYVRSWRGSRGRWYRHALITGTGRIRGAGTERDVAFTRHADPPHEDLDRGYRTKYARYDPSYVEPMTAGPARAATLRLDPAMTALPTPTRREGHAASWPTTARP